MLRVIVEVQIAGQPHAQDLEVPADLPTAELGLLIGKALDANRDAFGRDLRYIVHLLPEDRRMRSDESLEAAEAWDGHTLVLTPIVAAWLTGDSGLDYTLYVDELTLGRADPAQVYTRNDALISLHEEPARAHVSRAHARLFCQDGQWQLLHLSQTNPSTVNGHPLSATINTTLRDGDRIELGSAGLTFHLGFPSSLSATTLASHVLSTGADPHAP